MAARNVRDAGTYGTWGISPTVRRALARNIMELRSAVEDDFRKQIVGLGLRPTGAVNLPARPSNVEGRSMARF